MVTAMANPTDTVMGPPCSPRLSTAWPTHPQPRTCICKEKGKITTVSVKCYWLWLLLSWYSCKCCWMLRHCYNLSCVPLLPLLQCTFAFYFPRLCHEEECLLMRTSLHTENCSQARCWSELGTGTRSHSLYNKTLHLKVKLILCGKFSVPDWCYKWWKIYCKIMKDSSKSF